MADTFTTNLALTKPEVGASDDTWGTKLNTDLDALDALFPSGSLAVSSGGTGGNTSTAARTNLGLGTMATQDASAVAISGGTATLSSATVSSSAPRATLNETDASTGNKNWSWAADGQTLTLRLYDDALSAYGTAVTVTRSGTSPSLVNFGTTLQVSGSVVFHAANIATAPITETQISDGSLLARVSSNETISGTWTYSTTPKKSGGGTFPFYASATQTGGSISVSTGAPSGSPAAGDIWIQHAA